MRAISFPLIACSLLLVGACATTSDDQKPGAAAPVEGGKPGASAKPQAVPQKPVARVDATAKPGGSAFAALKDPNSILSKRSVFFDYDQFEIKSEYRSLIEAHARFLRDNPSAKMLIQGNADDRGSREYNVGLGQRRSDSVKKMLTLMGAREDQIESVSLGEEKPICNDAAEGCWSKNRRGDMLYSGEY
ncbi:MAG TPA: peptidoglycan-associated lipoprotein Pal [Burkholderiales bacterium]|nr:peptidoglycan-associated lipoprotein Pal [Burkholderiales bacterium]